MDALFGFVAPKRPSNINVKVDWSLFHFSQNFNIQITHRFSARALGRCQNQRELDLVVIKEKMVSQLYMDEAFMPAVLPFL